MILPTPFIKICSLREPEHAEFAVSAGATAVGLIFAAARRQVTVERAVELADEVRRLGGSAPPLVAGVFLDQDADEVNRTAEAVGLDLVQLHGHDNVATAALVERPVMLVVQSRVGTQGEAADQDIEHDISTENPPIALHVDAYSPDAAGGTGRQADWGAAARLAMRWPVVLAGGLSAGNVAEAIRAVRPIGVDVSSGVETDGVKDREKVLAFVTAARGAYAALEVDEPRVIPSA